MTAVAFSSIEAQRLEVLDHIWLSGAPFFPIGLAQLALENLARGFARQGFLKANFSRNLVVGETTAKVLLHGRLGQ